MNVLHILVLDTWIVFTIPIAVCNSLTFWEVGKAFSIGTRSAHFEALKSRTFSE